MNGTNEACRAADLERRLDAYDAQARPGPARPGRWAAYAAAVGSSLALTTAADAGIIYSGVQNIPLALSRTFGKLSQLPFKSSRAIGIPIRSSLKTKGVNRLSLVLRASTRTGPLGTRHGAYLRARSASTAQLVTTGKGLLKKFKSGAIIPGKSASFSFFGVMRKTAFRGTPPTLAVSGTWPPGKAYFAGFYFKTAGGAKDFGWIRLVWTAGQLGHPKTLTAIDWANYDNKQAVGQPIVAGNRGLLAAVPEPGTLSLMLLAMGSAGVLAWRRRLKDKA